MLQLHSQKPKPDDSRVLLNLRGIGLQSKFRYRKWLKKNNNKSSNLSASKCEMLDRRWVMLLVECWVNCEHCEESTSFYYKSK